MIYLLFSITVFSIDHFHLISTKANCPDPWIVPEKGSGCFLHSNESMNFFEAEEVIENLYLKTSTMKLKFGSNSLKQNPLI